MVPSAGGTPVVDAAVHPAFPAADDLRRYMREPLRRLGFPGPTRFLQPVPTTEPIGGAFVQAGRIGDAFPGSDRESTLAWLRAAGIDAAVLVPLTRGLNPNLDLQSEICRATNDWLAETWLTGEDEPRLYGSIRVAPEDVASAVAEIERWADDPRMVQIAVGLESHQPYGQRVFTPVWEAAAAAGLPVSVHSDGGTGTSFQPTANGYPHYFAEYDSVLSLNFVYHLTSLIAEGTFERLDGLRFVFGDGGHDALMPFMWRMDIDWPSTRIETPWITRMPTRYLAGHVRFLSSRLEGPPASVAAPEWSALSRAGELLMFASHFPHWSAMTPEHLPALGEDERAGVLGGNAAAFLRVNAARRG